MKNPEDERQVSKGSARGRRRAWRRGRRRNAVKGREEEELEGMQRKRR